jgi:hypothetical protein
MDRLKIEEAQGVLCKRYGAAFLSTPPEDTIGFAPSTAGLMPINGLRHPVTLGMSGWYIWCGESFSESGDFFAPHSVPALFYKGVPGAGRLLRLPVGYRFLLAGDYVDVWYDERLLNL